MLQRIKCRRSALFLDLRLSLDTEKEEKRMIKEQLVNLEVSAIFCTRSSLDIDFSVLNILTTNCKCIDSDFHSVFQKSSKEQISSLQEEVEKVILKHFYLIIVQIYLLDTWKLAH